MPPLARSLRYAAKEICQRPRLPIFRTIPSNYQHKRFSTSPIQRAKKDKLEKDDDVDEESTEREVNLRRALMRIPKTPKQKAGFQNLEEEPTGMTLEDEEFNEDDISSLAHGQLDEHRERREYLRIAAWEMPLLTKMAKRFELPTSTQPLRFRYTSYLGENHPAERKVVLEFCPADMPDLTDMQRSKLIKLLGPRYNPETEIAKMSSDMFDNQAQNKRYLGDLVDKLLVEARDPTDTFEDVPFDTRHHVFKIKPKFPKEWRIDEERQAALNEARQKTKLLEEQKQSNGVLIDGLQVIDKAFEALSALKEPAAEAVMVGVKGKRQQKQFAR